MEERSRIMIARERKKGERLSAQEGEEADAAIAYAIANGESSYKLSRKLSISARTLITRAAKLGLKFHSSRFWREAELSELERLAKLHSAKEIAILLGRDCEQIRQQCYYRRIPLKTAQKLRS